MNVSDAIKLIFADRHWPSKLVVTAFVTLFSILLTPILLGLVGWAALLGYQTQIVRNIRLRNKTPIPHWNNLEQVVGWGIAPLIALFIFNLPNAILFSLMGWMLFSGSNTFTGTSASIAALCCVTPFLFIYNVFIQPLLAIGMARYSDSREIKVFFQLSENWRYTRTRTNDLFQWILNMLILSVGVFLLLFIPILGWGLILALAFPLYAVCIGQFASHILIDPPQIRRSS